MQVGWKKAQHLAEHISWRLVQRMLCQAANAANVGVSPLQLVMALAIFLGPALTTQRGYVPSVMPCLAACALISD